MTHITDTHPAYVAGTWKLDPTHSEVTFSVKHLAISKVRGSFETFDATLVTAENPNDSAVTASIEIVSVNTNQKDRDQHLRTNDFFKADEFPTMNFVSTSVTLAGDNLTVVGDLTLRGVTKAITFTGEFGGINVDGYGQTKAGIAVSTKINRHDFGVSWNTALETGGFMLGDDVTINLEAQFTLQAA